MKIALSCPHGWSASLLLWLSTMLLPLKCCWAQNNDECSQALDITLPFAGTSLTTTGAVPSAAFTSPACDIGAGLAGVWYRFNAPSVGLMRATLSNQDFTARLSVHAGTDCSECIGNTRTSSISNLQLEWVAESADITYFILVSGSSATQTGAFDLAVDLVEPAPAHTACNGAVPISANFTAFATTVATVGGEFEDLSCDVDAQDRGLWYQLTVDQDVVVRAVVDDKSFTARLSLYRGDDCGTLECIVNTNAFSSSDSILEFVARVGQTYYLLVSGGDADDAGTFRLTVTGLSQPSNQFCTGATGVTQLPFEVFESNQPAVNGFSSLACNVDQSSRGLWYSLTLDDDTVVVATVSDQEFDAALSVYRGSCSDLDCRFGQSSYFQYSERSLITAASAGTTFYYRVSGQDFADAGNFRFSIEVRTCGSL